MAGTYCVLASGPSMSQEVADSVRDLCKVVAVSDSYRLAPWADAVASTDRAWWDKNPEALSLDCLKFGAMPDFKEIPEVERIITSPGTNSGLLGLMVAVKLGAKKVLLCGFDMNRPGDHFFGRHTNGLSSTTHKRMEQFKNQFKSFRPRGVEIINCTPGSGLDVYPRASLEDCLAELEVRARDESSAVY